MKQPKLVITVVKRYRKRMEDHKARVTQHGYDPQEDDPRWTDVIPQMVAALQPHVPKKLVVRAIGPSGLCCRLFFSAEPPGLEEKPREAARLGRSFNVEPDFIHVSEPLRGCGWLHRDFSKKKDKNNFRPETIGALNGLNHPFKVLRSNLTFAGLARMMQ